MSAMWRWALPLVGVAGVVAAIAQTDTVRGAMAQAPVLRTVVAPHGFVLKKDDENYKQGPYVAFAADWSVTTGKVKLRRDTDYADHLVINPATFPAGTVMHWQWPGHKPPSGVYGYLHVAYGNYAGGAPLQRVAPVQVAQLGNVATDFAVTITGDPADHNLLSETFLTAQPARFATRGLEVGFLPSVSADGGAFFAGSEQMGSWTDPGGRRWNVAIRDKYCMLIPADGTFTRGTLYFGAVLHWLMTQHRLTGREWFNGLAIGIEPVQGSGTMRIDRWRVRAG